MVKRLCVVVFAGQKCVLEKIFGVEFERPVI